MEINTENVDESMVPPASSQAEGGAQVISVRYLQTLCMSGLLGRLVCVLVLPGMTRRLLSRVANVALWRLLGFSDEWLDRDIVDFVCDT